MFFVVDRSSVKQISTVVVLYTQSTLRQTLGLQGFMGQPLVSRPPGARRRPPNFWQNAREEGVQSANLRNKLCLDLPIGESLRQPQTPH